MKLISFRIDQYRVLRNITIPFERNQEERNRISEQTYSLDFLAGVNGTGKSTILQLLAKLFTTLESENYHFPVPIELVYTLKAEGDEAQRVRVTNLPDEENPEGGTGEIRHFLDGTDLGTAKMRPELLPAKVVVYSTGSEQSWIKELALEPERTEEDQSPAFHPDLVADRYLHENPGHRPKLQMDDDNEEWLKWDKRLLFISARRFSLVTLCGLLASRDMQMKNELEKEPLQSVLKSIGLKGLGGFSLRLRSHRGLTPKIQDGIIRRLEPAADQIIQSGADRLLLFDVQNQLNPPAGKETTIFSLYDTPIQLFQHLNLLYEHRRFYDAPLREVNLFLKREDTSMLHLFDWLSDGEQSFLGRMALFTLFRADNLLIILDEPEVHFNDVWKREIVHMLDEIMAGCHSHAVISTHSSIALTDVPQNDIIVMRRLGQFVEGDKAVKEPGIKTLGADPSDIMVHVFGTQFASGEHSVRQIRRRIAEATSIDQLTQLSNSIAPGYWQYRVQLEMEQFGEVRLQ